MVKLTDYSWVVVNTSGGKDSMAAMLFVLKDAQAQGYPKDRIVLSHACLGESEWPGTLELVQDHAKRLGLRLAITRYRNAKKQDMSLLEYVEKRGKWPSNKQRFCTSELKRGPGNRVLTLLSREQAGPMLQVFGFRSEESPARAKKAMLVANPRASSSARPVFDWLPIHRWTEAEVWEEIEASGLPYHRAYDLGMKRLSCVFCIFAPQQALLRAAHANPELLRKYVAVEDRIGHAFQDKKPLRKTLEAMERGDLPVGEEELWRM